MRTESGAHTLSSAPRPVPECSSAAERASVGLNFRQLNASHRVPARRLLRSWIALNRIPSDSATLRGVARIPKRGKYKCV